MTLLQRRWRPLDARRRRLAQSQEAGIRELDKVQQRLAAVEQRLAVLRQEQAQLQSAQQRVWADMEPEAAAAQAAAQHTQSRRDTLALAATGAAAVGLLAITAVGTHKCQVSANRRVREEQQRLEQEPQSLKDDILRWKARHGPRGPRGPRTARPSDNF